MIRTKDSKQLLFRIAGLSGLILLFTGFIISAGPLTVGEEQETCSECHDDVPLQAPHSLIGENSCTVCHGDAEKHLEEPDKGTIFSFGESAIPAEKSKACLTCHTKNSARFMAGPHGKASLDCLSCHIVHSEKSYPNSLKMTSHKSCAICHEDIYAQFNLNERHRLQEGVMSCSTCHDPHEPGMKERLGGFKHESCFRCHADKGGPFLYEHEASRIEGCTVCHEVHGSPNKHMLIYQSVSDLCFSCHTVAPSWHARFDSLTTNCTVCHSTIHGSNLDKEFLK